MDFLDPKKQRLYGVRLFVGYCGVAIAILAATWLLLNAAYGFGLSQGKVIQTGIVFISSHPSGSNIYLDNELENNTTNTRLSIISGTHALKISRTGYGDWQRTINVIGGSVAHYDYPLLIPSKLVTKDIKSYDGAPTLVTQSPDRRWMLVMPGGATGATFDAYDLKNPKLAPTPLVLPAGLASSGANQTWQVVEWAGDNVHALLQHTFAGKTEFILVDRTDPTLSLNLNTELGISPTQLNLVHSKYDQYYAYDATTHDVDTLSLSKPAPVTLLQNVLNYKSYGSSILYVSSAASGAGKIAVDLYQDGKTYNLHELPAGSPTLLDITQYNGSWYVAFGTRAGNKIHVYKNPVVQLGSKLGALVPIYELKLTAPDYLDFSPGSQYIAAENGSNFVVFDLKNDEGYSYNSQLPLDAPQSHATWMDGNRLIYVSGGHVVLFDYDHANVHTLNAASAAYAPVFNPGSTFMDVLTAPGADGHARLTSTALLTPADQ